MTLLEWDKLTFEYLSNMEFYSSKLVSKELKDNTFSNVHWSNTPLTQVTKYLNNFELPKHHQHLNNISEHQRNELKMNGMLQQPS